MIEKTRNFLFKIFKRESFIGKIIDKLFTKEIIMYIIFGVATTLVNYITTFLLKKFVFTTQATGEFTLCNAIAWAVSVIFAFFTNKLFVFESKSFKFKVFIKEFLSFTAARIISGIAEIFLPEILMNIGLDQTVFGVKGMVAKLVVSVFVIIFNFFFSKLIAFRHKDKTGEEQDASSAEKGENL